MKYYKYIEYNELYMKQFLREYYFKKKENQRLMHKTCIKTY